MTSERGGIQPVVTATANGGARAAAKVGVETELPPGAGTVVAIDWDFDGMGKFPHAHRIQFPH